MVMRAFFDESGLNPHEDTALVMGGYLGTVLELEKASDRWDACLGAHPTIDYFKSDEAKSLDGEFRRFNRVAADQKKNDLAKIVGESELQGFCVSVRHELLAHRDSASTKGTAGSRTYDWGFFTATSGVLQYMRDHYPPETVDFIFDDRRELGQCIAMFDELKELAGEETPWADIFSRAGTCTPGDDKVTAALQMGDLLAGEFSDMGNGGNPPTETWRHLTARRGVAHVPCDMPWAIPVLVALQGKIKDVRDTVGRFLKRFHKDQERSADLSALADELIFNEGISKAAINALLERVS